MGVGVGLMRKGRCGSGGSRGLGEEGCVGGGDDKGGVHGWLRRAPSTTRPLKVKINLWLEGRS